MGQIVTGVEDAILNCFDKLSAEHSYNQNVENGNVHYYNGWKTNKAHYVNSKCVIPTYGCFARGYKTDKHGNWKDTLEGLDVRGCFLRWTIWRRRWITSTAEKRRRPVLNIC